MIRQGFLFWVMLAGGAGVALFLLKYEVQAREDRLAHINAEIIRTQEAIQVLRAEWSYLNRPDRLADLAQRHLDLVPATGRQISVSLAAVPDAPPADTQAIDNQAAGQQADPARDSPAGQTPVRGDPMVSAPLDKPSALGPPPLLAAHPGVPR